MQVVEQNDPIARRQSRGKSDDLAVERGRIHIVLSAHLERKVLHGRVVGHLQDYRTRALRRESAEVAPQGDADLNQSHSFNRASAIFSAVIGSACIRTPAATAMALAIAAGGWMQGGSPTPFAP